MKVISALIFFLMTAITGASFAAHFKKNLGSFVQNTGIYCDLEVFDKSGKSLGEIKKNNLRDPYGVVYVDEENFPITIKHRTDAGGWCRDIKDSNPLPANCYNVGSNYFSSIYVHAASCDQ